MGAWDLKDGGARQLLASDGASREKESDTDLCLELLLVKPHLLLKQ
jgi:hypothetical protein